MLNVFFTGSSLGRLKPCGCSGGQLGGLERRPAVFNSVPAEKRLLIDTGSLVETNSDQDLIKFDIIVEALGLLDYHVVNLTEEDFEIAENRGLLGNPAVRFISPYGTGDEMAAHTFLDNIRKTINRVADNRQAGRHRFQQRQGQSFPK